MGSNDRDLKKDSSTPAFNVQCTVYIFFKNYLYRAEGISGSFLD